MDNYKFENSEVNIKCPYCDAIESAEVLHKMPFDDLTYKCSHCDHWVMESEWEYFDINGNKKSFLRSPRENTTTGIEDLEQLAEDMEAGK